MERTFSGKFMVRVPVDLHAHLAAEAQKQGVSLNTLIVSLLAGGSGFELAAEREKER